MLYNEQGVLAFWYGKKFFFYELLDRFIVGHVRY